MTFETFLIIISLLYFCQSCIFIYGLRRNKDNYIESSNNLISVIIAARNEENNLANCLESIANQTYDKSFYEVIIVNDDSSDRTENICQEYSQKYSNIKYINAKPNEYMRGKGNALAQGIDIAKNEIILITDADCVVPKTWVEQTAKRYSDDTGLVGGFTLQKATRPFEGMQSIDWAYILGLSSAFAGFKNPLGSIGNNLSFRKSVYNLTGGYRKLKFSVTEDYTLVQAIISLKKWKYVYPIDPKHLVLSEPCKDFKTLVRQKQRWGKGGLDMKIAGMLIMIIGYLMNISPFIILFWGQIIVAATAFLIKFIADYIFLYNVLKKLNRTDELKWFYWFELYFTIYVIALPFLIFFGGKVKWKGRNY